MLDTGAQGLEIFIREIKIKAATEGRVREIMLETSTEVGVVFTCEIN